MRDYVDDLARRVLARLAITDFDVLADPKVEKSLKEGVVKLAAIVCSCDQMMVLFWLLKCDATWTQVWDQYNAIKSDSVDLESVRRMARRAKSNIVRAASEAPEFNSLSERCQNRYG